MLDINPPLREDLLSGPAVDVDFRLVDVADRVALLAAFNAPWPDDVDTSASLSVFHTASTIRFYERHAKLLARSEHVNVHGTRNVIDAARAAGADVLIYTSSGSVATRKTRFLLWPWEPEPEMVVQHLGDDDVVSDAGLLWSNYAISKGVAEKLVREADATLVGEGMMRTGCIRPSNGMSRLP